jgi:hypothetical protein
VNGINRCDSTSLHEPSALPKGFGVRQSSGAFRWPDTIRKRQRTAADVQDAAALVRRTIRLRVPWRGSGTMEARHVPERRSPIRRETRHWSQRAGSATGAPVQRFEHTVQTGELVGMRSEAERQLAASFGKSQPTMPVTDGRSTNVAVASFKFRACLGPRTIRTRRLHPTLPVGPTLKRFAPAMNEPPP